jgi:uncharacterized protein YdeI (YjbR/CyaY-like superfamily)
MVEMGSAMQSGSRRRRKTKQAPSKTARVRKSGPPPTGTKRRAAEPTLTRMKAFETPGAWAGWLAEHHADADGVWLRFFKKDSGVPSITYSQALDEALCWGWIDGQARPRDSRSWLQRFTPRRPRSAWSKRNRDHVARLEREGRMQPSGREQVEAAKRNGRWDQAYDSPANSEVPEDFLRTLRRDKRALAFFQGLNRANVYAICYRLQTAKKPETRRRRLEAILQMMKEGRPFH